MPADNRVSSARYDGEPDTQGDFTDEFAAVAYDAIARRLDDRLEYRVYDDGIMFDKYRLTLSCTIQRIGESKGHFSAETLYMLNHSLFDEPLCEYCSGVGSTAEEAIINGASQFASSVLLSVFSAFDSTGDSCLVSEFGGKTRIFKLSDEAPVHVLGEEFTEYPDLYSVVDTEIPNYLGSKKAYWIKLYAVCFDDMISTEVRINGAVMHDLSDKLREYAMSWQDKKSFHSEKQFILLLDTNENEDREYPSAELVISLTKEGIELLSGIHDEKSDRAAVEKLKKLCGKWERLAYEIRALVPELYTCEMFHLDRGDVLKLRFGSDLVELKRSQLRNFGYIEQGILQFISEFQPSDEFSLSIVNLSTTIGIISDAINSGLGFEDIAVRELIVAVPENYELL